MAYSLLLILAVTGNSLVIAVIWKKRKSQTVINLFIFNMAISDITTSVSALPYRIQTVDGELRWLRGTFCNVFCKLHTMVENTSVVVSVVTLVVIAIERFVSVIYPFQRQKIDSKEKCFTAIALIWVISAVLSASWLIPTNYLSWLIIISFITLVPFLLLTFTYGAIIVSLHRQKASLHLSSEIRRRRIKENRRVTFMSLSIVLVFLVSWLMFTINQFIGPFLEISCNSQKLTKLHFTGEILTFVYTAINPLVYFMFNEHYRRSILELLCLCRRSDRVSPAIN